MTDDRSFIILKLWNWDIRPGNGKASFSASQVLYVSYNFFFLICFEYITSIWSPVVVTMRMRLNKMFIKMTYNIFETISTDDIDEEVHSSTYWQSK